MFLIGFSEVYKELVLFMLVSSEIVFCQARTLQATLLLSSK